MKVKILTGSMARGKRLIVDEVYNDLEDADAAYLVRTGQAEEVKSKNDKPEVDAVAPPPPPKK